MAHLQNAVQKAANGERLNDLEGMAICNRIIELINELDAIHSADMQAVYARQKKAA